ncbi:MAG: TetR family transcriptional regulator C-terminal domain-containing protein [Candidatus Accumulibacter phosphatis]|nr:TetR family transcriptional regulator C-terminal domain-containing protein [Candidatus Accumulibacter phosphatis]
MCSRATLPLQSRLEQAADGDGDDAIATLHAVSVQAMREIALNPRTRAVLEILLCKSERLPQPADGAPQIDEMDRQCANALERIIVRAIVQGHLSADTDSHLAAHLLQAFFHGVIQHWLMHPEAFDLNTAAPAMVDTMIAGLVAAPPRRGAGEGPGSPCVRDET